MKVRKSLIVACAAGSLGLASVGALAATSTNSSGSLVDDVTNHFHLNKSEVQQVFDNHRKTEQANHEQKYEDRLNQAVKDGKLTSDQKDKILAKHKEMISFMESLKDKTPQERHDAMKTKMDELKTWEKDNNIPVGYLGGPGMGHHGFGHGPKGDGPGEGIGMRMMDGEPR